MSSIHADDFDCRNFACSSWPSTSSPIDRALDTCLPRSFPPERSSSLSLSLFLACLRITELSSLCASVVLGSFEISITSIGDERDGPSACCVPQRMPPDGRRPGEAVEPRNPLFFFVYFFCLQFLYSFAFSGSSRGRIITRYRTLTISSRDAWMYTRS